jgi:hypothetical protein
LACELETGVINLLDAIRTLAIVFFIVGIKAFVQQPLHMSWRLREWEGSVAKSVNPDATDYCVRVT